MLEIIEKIVYNETIPYSDNLTSTSKLAIATFSICSGFSSITNLLNTLVLFNSKMKDVSFTYMLAISISNLLFSIFVSFGSALFCNECHLNYVYQSQLYRILVFYVTINALNLFSVLCDVTISLHRYFILKNMKFFSDKSIKWLFLAFTIFSLICELNILFSYDILKKIYSSSKNSTIVYAISYSSSVNVFGKETTYFTITEAAIKVFFNIILLSFLNFVNLYEFQKRYNKKIKFKYKSADIINKGQQLNNVAKADLSKFKEKEVNKKITLMILLSIGLSIIGALPRYSYLIYRFIYSPTSGIFFPSLVTLNIFIFSNGLNFFIYVTYNRMFRKILISYFNKIIYC